MPSPVNLRAVYDTFSFRRRRQAPSRALPDITSTFRTRILLYWRDYVEPFPELLGLTWGVGSFWFEMNQRLQHLYGRASLSSASPGTNPLAGLLDFLNTCTTAEFFDFLEQAFKLDMMWGGPLDPNDIVAATNEMFRIDDLPFELTKLTYREIPFPDRPDMTYTKPNSYPQVIVVDEQVIHKEAVQPALAILAAPHFRSADAEFRKALAHYRQGEFADCLTACGTTMESTLKVLCDRNKWPYKQADTLKPLLDIAIAKTSLDGFFSQPIMLVGTMRNRLSSAHGAGTKERTATAHIAQYAITSTAAAMVLLIKEADR